MATMASQPRLIAIAPAGGNGMPTPQQEDVHEPPMPFACITCSRRKVKCDKTGPPCSTCRKGKLECHYEAPAPRKRKRRPIDDVNEKLDRYERVLKQHGLLDKAMDDSSSDSIPSELSHATFRGPAAAPTDQKRTGKLLGGRGKTRYIDSQLWKDLDESGLNPWSDDEDNNEDPEPHSYEPASAGNPVSASLLGGTVAQRSLLHLHPTYDVAMKLWSTYCTHVDPITRLMHVPTGSELVQQTAADPSTASKATECLLFGIYHFAIVAMTDSECEKLLGQSRSILRSRYYDALRQALVNASFLRTSELAVLQAYVMFLLSVRNQYDPHTFWILTGVAIRIAQRIGLHRDGETLKLKPFDVEIRRRVFWQLLPLDGMSAKRTGTGIAMSHDSWDTKHPLNVNDEDLYPDMTEPPAERTGATDMIFCLVRAEIGKFHQGNKLVGKRGLSWEVFDESAIASVEAAADELERMIESKFLRYCDIVEPLHCLTMIMARSAITLIKLRLNLYSVRAHSHSLEERVAFTNLALKVLDHDIMAHANGTIKRYMWHVQAIVQFHPLVWILNELRNGSKAITDPQAVWNKIEQMFNCHPELLSPKRALHVAVCKLTLRAWDVQQPLLIGYPEPAFISQMRSAVDKRESANSDRSLPSISPSDVWIPGDPSRDVFAFPYENLGGNVAEGYPPVMMDHFNGENMDWMFWDHLIGDPNVPMGTESREGAAWSSIVCSSVYSFGCHIYSNS